eukprot:TRINITY_DN30121_c0_g1_i1.p1 TRINITY_DN30121_c0_g1~~TRINITY_DN30121_c0_g1_i1.p1  ORF type:complete len:480 (+),score=104.64 TRINITY_DN30121_c0_g1_i1:75-1442(+)
MARRGGNVARLLAAVCCVLVAWAFEMRCWKPLALAACLLGALELCRRSSRSASGDSAGARASGTASRETAASATACDARRPAAAGPRPRARPASKAPSGSAAAISCSAWWPLLAGPWCCAPREPEPEPSPSCAGEFEDFGSKVSGGSSCSSGASAAFCAKSGLTADEAEQVAELLRRLDDLLGPAPADAAVAASARYSVERLGGTTTCLLRFLRARRRNVCAAEDMLRKSFEFRRAVGVNDILENPKVQALWEELRPLWPMVPVMFSADGSLVTYTRLALFLEFWQLGIPEDRIRLVYISFMEHTKRLERERRLALRGKQLDARDHGAEALLLPAYEIYDLQGLGVTHVACLVGLRMMGRVLRIGQDHYPENLRKAVFVNVPAIAAGAFNAFIRRVFDAHTLSKFAVTSTDGRELLGDLLPASPSQLDSIYGSIVPHGRGRAAKASVIGFSPLGV